MYLTTIVLVSDITWLKSILLSLINKVFLYILYTQTIPKISLIEQVLFSVHKKQISICYVILCCYHKLSEV